MDVNDISQKVRLLFLRFNGCFQFGDLDSVVGGQRECGRGSNEGGDVPLASLAFWHMKKAGQEVLEEFEDLPEV
jgi:hypothetical protein